MRTTDDVLRWAQAQLDSVRHDLNLLDRGIDIDGVAGRDVAKLSLGGQEIALCRLIQCLTGAAPSQRASLPEWTPCESSPGVIDWKREGVRLRDEQGAPHHERWAITALLPDGRRVTTNYATTLAEAMQKGDDDVEVVLSYKKSEKHIDDQSACVDDVMCPDYHYVENKPTSEDP